MLNPLRISKLVVPFWPTAYYAKHLLNKQYLKYDKFSLPEPTRSAAAS